MAKLRFEIWESPLSQECGAVSESLDRIREADARFVEAFRAATYEEAMSYHYERNGWGPFKAMPGVTDQPFTEDQLAEQNAYLAIRPLRWSATD